MLTSYEGRVSDMKALIVYCFFFFASVNRFAQLSFVRVLKKKKIIIA